MKHIRKLMVLAALLLPLLSQATDITSLASIGATGDYVITADIDASGFSTIASFSGTLEADINPATHMPYRIKNLSVPLFTTLSGTVKNLVIESVGISGHEGNTGAIACTANGTARIYNVGILSGSVGGTGNVGGLVGLLDHNGTDNGARVINCYSYASITGGNYVGGIVGYNNYTSKSDDLRTMVMNCMFYGNVSGATNVAPIYNGKKITNRGDQKGLNNFNYFSYEDLTVGINTYNCALGVEKRSYLQRFEFYRGILNANRELACWYAIGSAVNAREVMLKWVIETADRTNANPYPYPVLKEKGIYPSIVNIDANHAEENQPRNQGGKLGTLSVTIQMDNTSDALVPYHHPTDATITNPDTTLIITDKDEGRYNFCYRKVQLPYYNDVGTGNYTGNRVVTGWKIVSMTGNSNNTFVANTTYPEGATNQDILGIDDCYNFADRTEIGKDLYGTSHRVFSQGAYFNVPDGVTAITIEPYWAKCTYLSDSHYDVTYNNGSTATYVNTMGTRYDNNSSYSINGSSQKVYTAMSNALSNLGRNASHTVYDYAVVLVGNYHQYCSNSSYTGNNYWNNSGNPSLPVTIMSADLDFDNEPDNVFILQHGKNRIGLCPIRYDFICIPEMYLTQKADGLTRLPSIGTAWPYGWYETTNTSLMHVTNVEYATTKKVVSPLILLGGIFDKNFVSFQGNEAANNNGSKSSNRTNYIHLGGNVYFDEFSNGSHINNKQFTAHVPISVTGGEYKNFYLSGTSLPTSGGPTEKADNAEGYIDGGKFGEVASGGMWEIQGNVIWIVYNADIENFYGGGINANKPVTGNISVTMRDCHVTTYCGGPKFGNMSSGKTVTSTINGGIFGTFFGAGYGGTSLTKQSTQQNNSFTNQNQWDDWANTYTRQYNASFGIASSYEFKYFQFSGGSDATQVGQMYVYFASLSLAQTNDVNTTMIGSTVTGNFYGGGSLGKAAGNVNSTLTNCTIDGNVFGAGFSATIPTVKVMNIGVTSPKPGFDANAGVFTEAGYPESVIYIWKHADNVSSNHEFDENGGHYILTTEDLTSLGTVSGTATLTLDGNTTVGTLEGGSLKVGTGNVYGGGDESAANDNTTVILKGSANVLGNVYGGGNKGQVGGSSQVLIQDQEIQNN